MSGNTDQLSVLVAELRAMQIKVAAVVEAAAGRSRASGEVVGAGAPKEDGGWGDDGLVSSGVPVVGCAFEGGAVLSVGSGAPLGDSAQASAATESWSDVMDRSDDEAPGGVGLASFAEVAARDAPVGGARGSVKSGSVDSGSGSEGAGAEAGFFATFVRVPRVLALKQEVERLAQVKFGKAHLMDLALLSYVPATIPPGFRDGVRRLKGYASVGDAALTLALVTRGMRMGNPASSMQQARTAYLSNAALRAAFHQSRLPRLLSTGGVDMKNSDTPATAIEALFGLVSMLFGSGAVLRMAIALKIFTV